MHTQDSKFRILDLSLVEAAKIVKRVFTSFSAETMAAAIVSLFIPSWKRRLAMLSYILIMCSCTQLGSLDPRMLNNSSSDMKKNLRDRVMFNEKYRPYRTIICRIKRRFWLHVPIYVSNDMSFLSSHDASFHYQLLMYICSSNKDR